MKQNRMINILFIFIVCVLVGLGILGFLLPTITSHRPALHLTPTIDVAGSVDQTLQAYYSATKTATPTPTLIPPTSTLPPPTATATSIPSENYITNFVARKQSYSIGCEASAAVDLAGRVQSVLPGLLWIATGISKNLYRRNIGSSPPNISTGLKRSSPRAFTGI